MIKEHKLPPKIENEKFCHQEFVKKMAPNNDKAVNKKDTIIPYLFSFINQPQYYYNNLVFKHKQKNASPGIRRLTLSLAEKARFELAHAVTRLIP